MKGSDMQIAAHTLERRDADMRAALEMWLRLQQHESEIRLIHEFVIPRPSARIDLALINGRISGYEIKSDVDSLSRLPAQMHSYSKIFEHLSFVTTERKSKSILQKTPEWCGVIAISREGRFKTLRKMKLNRNVDAKCLLYSLDKVSIGKIVKTELPKKYNRSFKKKELIEICLKNMAKSKIIKACRNTLKAA